MRYPSDIDSNDVTPAPVQRPSLRDAVRDAIESSKRPFRRRLGFLAGGGSVGGEMDLQERATKNALAPFEVGLREEDLQRRAKESERRYGGQWPPEPADWPEGRVPGTKPDQWFPIPGYKTEETKTADAAKVAREQADKAVQRAIQLGDPAMVPDSHPQAAELRHAITNQAKEGPPHLVLDDNGDWVWMFPPSQTKPTVPPVGPGGALRQTGVPPQVSGDVPRRTPAPPPMNYRRTAGGVIPVIGQDGQPVRGLPKTADVRAVEQQGSMYGMYQDAFNKFSNYIKSHQTGERMVASGALKMPFGVGGALDEFVISHLDPESSTVSSSLNNLADRLLRLRSGAQINQEEYNRLRTLLPKLGEGAESAMTKFSGFHDELMRILRIHAAERPDLFSDDVLKAIAPHGGDQQILSRALLGLDQGQEEVPGVSRSTGRGLRMRKQNFEQLQRTNPRGAQNFIDDGGEVF